jgi:GAF domain-containing protein
MKNTFGKSIIPDNEEERLAALDSYEILNTLPEGFFNNLAHIVARTFETPIALISLVDREQVFFKANVGMQGTTHVDRGISLCSLAILDKDLTVFPDATEEPCLISNPLVAGEFGLRFYAGAPITTPDGFNIGTVCVVDKKPRIFSDLEQELLVQFAKSAMEAIEDRKKNMVFK